MSSAAAKGPKASERIQIAAKDLFYRHGIRATGIEEVCRVAEATKMSLYRTYPSKDALVAAILCEDSAAYDAWFAAVTGAEPTAAGKLRALVAAVAAKLAMPDYRGCPLLLAQTEFPDPSHPIHQLVAEHKAQMRQGLAALAAEAGVAEPAQLGDTLALLFDGGWASLPYLGAERAGEVLLQSAEALLRMSLPADSVAASPGR
ncbi:TetR/AcrR family transcriptional regulator [Paeniroseomonas aquatica]|uniref:TetR/AcrR family transcriptional regulator n=1 Tax=Paeniroseomonas aquatica TaxID=373043 RepID=A0ABT8A457_9PROT|nr:TetR/AcrR family transcriptional regulator [Paeniroseomonas aquatica]MDN3564416.1 TetR/AcrR family transcriptional regulator [Paeniroseomonas aquatica]